MTSFCNLYQPMPLKKKKASRTIADNGKETIMLVEVIDAQSRDTFSNQMAKIVGTPKSDFTLNQQRVLVRCANLDAAIQIVGPESLRGCILPLTHHPPLTGLPGEQQMYDTLRGQSYRMHVTADVQKTFKTCQQCQKGGTKFAQQRQHELFPANRSLESIAIYILGPLLRTKEGMRYVVVMTDRYSILTRGMATETVTSTNAAKIFVEQRVIPYKIPKTVLAGNGQQVVRKFSLHFV